MRTLMATALFGADIPEEVKAFQAAQATQTLEVFEKMLNQHKGAFLVSDQPTIADLQIFYELLDLLVAGPKWTNYPAISAWHDKVLEITEVKQVQELNAVAVAPLLAAFASKMQQAQ